MKNWKHQIRESIDALIANPLRSALSITGVVFGVASVVAMLAIGMGAEAEIEAMLASLGSQNIHVTSKNMGNAEWQQVLKSSYGLSNRDLTAIRELYPEAQVMAVSKWRSGSTNIPLQKSKLTIYGMTANYRKVLGVKLATGRSFSDFENQVSRPVAVIGEGLAKKWFGTAENATGKTFRVDQAWFTIIGVAGTPDDQDKPNSGKPEMQVKSDKTSDLQLMNLHSSIFVPIGTATSRLGPQSVVASLERVVLKLSDSADPIVTRKRLEHLLRRVHRNAEVIQVTSADEIIEQKRETTRLFSYFLMTIALISLVVGGIGIANVMLAGMVERIREVGLRRAIGAKKSHIMWQFLTESMVICVFGGIIGGLVGIIIGLVIGSITGWQVAFPWWGLIVALLISTIVGLIAGIFPALTAARISPIEALQGRA